MIFCSFRTARGISHVIVPSAPSSDLRRVASAFPLLSSIGRSYSARRCSQLRLETSNRSPVLAVLSLFCLLQPKLESTQQLKAIPRFPVQPRSLSWPAQRLRKVHCIILPRAELRLGALRETFISTGFSETLATVATAIAAVAASNPTVRVPPWPKPLVKLLPLC